MTSSEKQQSSPFTLEEVKLIIVNEFEYFVNCYNDRRQKFLRQNKNLFVNKSNCISNDFTSNNQLIITNKQKDDNQFIESYFIGNLNLDVDIVPKGIYVCPVTENIRQDEQHSLDFIPPFENYTKHEEIMQNIETHIDEWFTEYPSAEDEVNRIDNYYFIVWTFITLIKKYLDNRPQNFTILKDNIKWISNSIIVSIAKLLNKDEMAVYNIISKYIFNILKSKDSNNEYRHKINLNKKYDSSLVSKYRKYFCVICSLYACQTHFVKEYIDSNNMPEKLKGIKFTKFKKKFNDYKIKKCNKLNININNSNINNSKNSKVKGSIANNINFKEENENLLECTIDGCETCKINHNFNNNTTNLNDFPVFKTFDELYLLTKCAFTFNNDSCFLYNTIFKDNNLLVDLKTIQYFSKYIKNENFLKEIEEQLKIINPKIDLINEIFNIYDLSNINYCFDTKKKKLFKKEFSEYTPCVHLGNCLEDNCQCARYKYIFIN